MNDERERQYVRALRLLLDELSACQGEGYSEMFPCEGEALAYDLLDAYYGTEDEYAYWPDLEQIEVDDGQNA